MTSVEVGKLFSVGLKATGILLPSIKKILLERSASYDHKKYDIINETLNDTIDCLFGSTTNKGVMKTISLTLKQKAIQPEYLKKHAILEWVKIHEVRETLKTLALDSAFGTTHEQDLYDYLLSAYSEKTGENEQHAKSIIITTIDVLTTSLRSFSKDNAQLAVSLLGFNKIQTDILNASERIENIVSKTEEIDFNTRINTETLGKVLSNQELDSGKTDELLTLVRRLVKHTSLHDNNAQETKEGETNDPINKEIDTYRDYIDSNPVIAIQLLEKLKERCWSNSNDTIKFRITSNIGASHYKLGNLNQAASLFLEAEQFSPNDSRALRNAALAHILLKNNSEAKTKALKACTVAPEEAENYPLLVLSNINDNHDIKFENLIPEQFHCVAESAFAIGTAYREANKPDESFKWIENAYKSEPTHLPYMASYATAILEKLLSQKQITVGRQVSKSALSEIEKPKEILSNIWEQVKDKDYAKTYISCGINLGTICLLTEDKEKFRDTLTSLLKINDTDKNVLKLAAQHFAHEKKYEESLQYLNKIQSDDQDIELIKAETYAENGEYEIALEIALNINAEKLTEIHKIMLQTLISGLQFKSGNANKAESLIGTILKQYPKSVIARSSISRIFKDNNEKSKAIDIAHEALNLLTNDTEFIERFDLAHNLFFLDDLENAIPVFEGIIKEWTDSDILQNYMICLVNNDKPAKLKHALERLDSETLSMPFYLKINALHNLKTGFLHKAINLNEKYLAINPCDIEMTIHWLSALLRTDQRDKVREFLETYDPSELADPLFKMKVAHFCNYVGLHEKSLKIAYSVCRTSNQTEHVHLAYINLFMFEDIPVKHPNTVDEDVYFEIQNDFGEKQSFVVDSLVTSPQDNEFPASHSIVNTFLGKHVGDEIIIDMNDFQSERWRIITIQSKFIYLFQKILNNFNKLHPESKALSQIKVKKNDGSYDFSSIFKAIDIQHDKSTEILSNYKQHLLPISLLAKLLGKHPLEVWTGLMNEKGVFIRCCVGTHDEREDSFRLSTDAEIVLDPLTLYNAHFFDVLDELKQQFNSLGVTQSTIDFFEIYLLNFQNPHRGPTLGKNNDHYIITEINPDAELQHSKLIHELVAWIKSNCTILPAIPKEDFKQEERINSILSSIDAVFIDSIMAASGSGRLLLSDDLALRAVAKQAFDVDGIWLQSALTTALENNKLVLNKYVDSVVKLVACNFTWTFTNTNIFLNLAYRNESPMIEEYKLISSTLSGQNIDYFSALSLAQSILTNIWSKQHPERFLLSNILFSSLISGKGSSTNIFIYSFFTYTDFISNSRMKLEYFNNLKAWCTFNFIPLDHLFSKANTTPKRSNKKHNRNVGLHK